MTRNSICMMQNEYNLEDELLYITWYRDVGELQVIFVKLGEFEDFKTKGA